MACLYVVAPPLEDVKLAGSPALTLMDSLDSPLGPSLGSRLKKRVAFCTFCRPLLYLSEGETPKGLVAQSPNRCNQPYSCRASPAQASR